MMPRLAETEVVTVEAAIDPRWESLVTNHSTSVFQSPPWLRVLSRTYEFPVHARLLIGTDGAPEAGVVYAEVEDFMDPRISSLPFSDYCDPIVADLQTWHRLADGLVAPGRRFDLRCLDSDVPSSDERFEVVEHAAWHGVDLERDLDDIWAQIHSSARRAIRKADTAGLIVATASTKEDLRTFYDLHLGIRKYKYRLLAQPFRFFERIWDEFIAEDKGFLLIAMLDGRAVGGILFLEWQGVLYYKFNASDRHSLSVRPNDRLIWEGIKIAKSRGLRLMDFGLSDLAQEGLVRYKRKYATKENVITHLRYSLDSQPSVADRMARSVLGELTDLFVDDDVPDDVTARAGDLLYRFFV